MPSAPPEAYAGPDRGLGVFETLLARDGRIQALCAHLRRLAVSVSALYAAELPAGLEADLRRRAGGLKGTHRLRVGVRPDLAGLRVLIESSPVDPATRRPVRWQSALVRGGLGPHKWADRRALDRLAAGDVVALIVDTDGHVLEAAWANLWLIEGRRLITPAADGRLLPGVTRAMLLGMAAELGFEAAEEAVSLDRLSGAATLFLTSSVRHAIAAAPAGPAAPAAEDPRIVAIRAALGERDWA